MIATGGLLRISARRQDSLRAKNRAENKRKRKAKKKKKKNDVVVIKGKLKLFSISGLVAAVGVVILLVGVAMAMLGYWPKESVEYAEPQLLAKAEKHQSSYDRTLSSSTNWTVNGKLGFSVGEDLVNFSQTNRTDTATPTLGLFERFLARCLYSDELKVFGPLVMGIGIFLFICANAVLHENRDRNTKIINLRDIYSTVIDIHSSRTKDCPPLNGFVNYVQSKNIDGKMSPSYSAAMLARSSWPSTVSGNLPERGGPLPFGRRSSSTRERQTFTDTVYSIYRDQNRTTERAPVPKPWETRTIVTSSVNAFTLPVIKLNNCELDEPKRSGGDEGRGKGGDSPTEVRAGSSHGDDCTAETKAESSRAGSFALRGSVETQEDAVRQQGVPRNLLQESQSQLLPPSPGLRAIGSHLSLNALSDYSRSADLGASASAPGERTRRLSCPRLDRTCSKGYIKLGDLGGESFESSDNGDHVLGVVTQGASQKQAQQATSLHGEGACNKTPKGSPWKYFNREKSEMITQSNTTEEEGELENTSI